MLGTLDVVLLLAGILFIGCGFYSALMDSLEYLRKTGEKPGEEIIKQYVFKRKGIVRAGVIFFNGGIILLVLKVLSLVLGLLL